MDDPLLNTDWLASRIDDALSHRGFPGSILTVLVLKTTRLSPFRASDE